MKNVGIIFFPGIQIAKFFPFFMQRSLVGMLRQTVKESNLVCLDFCT